jgi:hypothetical protein
MGFVSRRGVQSRQQGDDVEESEFLMDLEHAGSLVEKRLILIAAFDLGLRKSQFFERRRGRGDRRGLGRREGRKRHREDDENGRMLIIKV